MTKPSPTTLPNSYETLDELRQLLAEADDDLANGRVRHFANATELRELMEDIKMRGRARLDAELQRSIFKTAQLDQSAEH